jgi:hypothetical protein
MFYVTLFGDNPFESYIEINLSIALTHFWFSNIPFFFLLDIIIALESTTCPTIYNMLGKFLSSGVVAPSHALQMDGIYCAFSDIYCMTIIVVMESSGLLSLRGLLSFSHFSTKNDFNHDDDCTGGGRGNHA